MKQYLLKYTFVTDNNIDVYIQAETDEGAITQAKEILAPIGGLEKYTLVCLGDIISFVL